MITVSASDLHRLHHVDELTPQGLVPSAERPERVDVIENALSEAGFEESVEASEFGLDPVKRVHSPAYVDFLTDAHREWIQSEGAPEDTDAFPLVFPTPDGPERDWTDIRARFGRHAFDTDAIGRHTWPAAVGAVDVALTGQQLVTDGARGVFSLCRPPGHHAMADRFGGYCYLNNAAISAQAFVDQGARPAILDLDFHHGNGTQSIFYDRNDVLYASLHADPSSDYPYFFGRADETGSAAGEGYNLNLPLPAGTDWSTYGEALDTAVVAITGFSPDVLVVSLGVDTALEDPDSFRLIADDYSRIGATVSSLGLPTLFIMEGGYELAVLGRNVAAVLTGFHNS